MPAINAPCSATPLRVMSGGQTGVDRAALDVAIAHGIEHGGWCPRGRLAEDGPLHVRYALQETESSGYRQRTRGNVRDSQGTLILNEGELSGGSALTARFAAQFGRPCLVVSLGDADPRAVAEWIRSARIDVLNVAGPGESKRPGIYARAYAFLERVLPLRLPPKRTSVRSS